YVSIFEFDPHNQYFRTGVLPNRRMSRKEMQKSDFNSPRKHRDNISVISVVKCSNRATLSGEYAEL
ncbi:hypothetical protein DRN77_02915, partial [Methanosarcinales archaeon]